MDVEPSAPSPPLGAVRRLNGAFVMGLRGALSLIYPPSCIACGVAVCDPHALCAACWCKLGHIERPYCERLGTPFPVDYGAALHSPAALADPPVFRRARAVARYDDVARDLVHRLKYGDRLDLARAMGAMMRHAGAELLADADVMVPVPLHRWRLWGRRFNQSDQLARVISRLSGVPCETGCMLRVRRTSPQVGLTRTQRRENLQGAFKIPDASRPLIQGRRVLLVDDVLTTGATANAVSRALLRAGATDVDVLAFARVVAAS
jgi:ComF family protein